MLGPQAPAIKEFKGPQGPAFNQGPAPRGRRMAMFYEGERPFTSNILQMQGYPLRVKNPYQMRGAHLRVTLLIVRAPPPHARYSGTTTWYPHNSAPAAAGCARLSRALLIKLQLLIGPFGGAKGSGYPESYWHCHHSPRALLTEARASCGTGALQGPLCQKSIFAV